MRIAIYGYGNLGRGVECAVINSIDAELFGVFTRRAPETVKTVSGCNVYHVDDILNYKDNKWWNAKNEAYFFEENAGDIYMLYKMKNETMAWGMKVKDYAPLSEAWQKRIGKTYVVTSASPLVIRSSSSMK